MRHIEKEINERLFVSVFIVWQVGLLFEYSRDNYATYIAVSIPFIIIDFGYKRSIKKRKQITPNVISTEFQSKQKRY